MAELACQLIGTDAVQSVRTGTGWPSVVSMVTAGGSRDVALHVASVGTHSRKPYEMRFQNPADSTPASAPGGSFPILVGVSAGPPPLLVATDGRPRVGKATRYPVLFHERVLEEAERVGWSEYTSSKGERIYGMHPRMLPILVEMLCTGSEPSGAALAMAAQASGLTDTHPNEEADLAAAVRARRAASVLVRQAGFGQAVKAAYQGRCAMCGLGIDLVQGAHILPASVPGSPDRVWNGLALCLNHHGLFDSHRVWVDPSTHRVRQHPDLIKAAKVDPIVRRFSDQLLPSLMPPSLGTHRPRKQMFEARYDHLVDKYDWA